MAIDNLILNNPFHEPLAYWEFQPETQDFEKRIGRRLSGYYYQASQRNAGPNDPGEFVTIQLVKQIRPRVKKWKEKGYPNSTGTTRKLLEFWNDRSVRESPFFFCQLEAVETAIFLTEGSKADIQGINIISDGSDWTRECLKLATGTGKTVVMAMLIVWQALNKLSNNRDTRFSKNILIMAPGITVKDRLQVLKPSQENNFYQEFKIVDSFHWQELQSAKIEILNWHALAPFNENSGPKVVKKGPESDEAFFRRVLPEFGSASNILIINDEAHHCHRSLANEEEDDESTIWISGLDKIHRSRGILKAYDLTATPYKPSGNNNQDELLFSWIVSDFGLNDAIESGLVKTPIVAVRDDTNIGQELRTRLFHIYPEVRDDLNRRAEPEDGLPDLVRNAINILGADWLKEKELWKNQEIPRETPPVMITICNRTETAARIEYSIKNGYIAINELGEDGGLLRIDQDALDKVESEKGISDSSKKEQALLQREKFNTVGKVGKPGQDVHAVIGVNMLSEGWDARTVTHILGLRAFSSQLLCEQVIGRGLRRISYDIDKENPDALFSPEYVTVFGVPFTFLPVEGSTDPPSPPTPKVKIAPILERSSLEIQWPHVIRIQKKLNYYLELNWEELRELIISPEDSPTVVGVAPILDGQPNFSRISEIDLNRLAEDNRLQKSMLQASVRLHEQLKANWPGDASHHVSQIMDILQTFLESDKLNVIVPEFEESESLRTILISLNLQKITNHISQFIRRSSKENPIIILDQVRQTRSTSTAQTWYTSRECQPIKKSQISHIVIDSGWEKIGLEFERDRIPNLISWVKNDHIGFEIYYMWQGKQHVYYPDFILKFNDDHYLVLEVKGQEREQDREKWLAMEEWVNGVNFNAKFGVWCFKVLNNPQDLWNIISTTS